MKISLTGADSQARSTLASSQRTLNLYAEATDPKQTEPGEVTHYLTPGIVKIGQTPNGKSLRCIYRATNGDLYGVAGFDVYYINPSFAFNLIGTMNTTSVLNPVKMADNGTSVIVADGSTNGYAITMSTRSGLAPLLDPTKGDLETPSSTGWLGSNYVDFSDGFFIANSPNTPTFYISNAQDTIFDPLQFGAKTSNADVLQAAIVQHRVVWLIGILSTEVWYDSGGTGGANNFPFEIMPAVAIDWGCAAQYSIAKAETQIFWLGQNLNGEVVVLKGSGYNVQRISTHAIEHQFASYSTVSDAVGYCYMQEGHSFYCLNFPSADVTWVYDLSMGQWHQRCWMDSNGFEHRQRQYLHAFAYDKNIVNDWENGNLYEMDLNAFTDNGQPIKRLIRFPRQVDNEDDHRVLYQNLTLEMDVGESLNPADMPMITLRWSNDKGKTWGNGMIQNFGKTGDFNRVLKFNRLGLARNRNFEVEWAADCFTALQGAYLTITKANN